MSLEDLISASNQLATITQEAADGKQPPQTTMGGTDRTGTWMQLASNVPCLLNNKSSQLTPYTQGRNNERQQVFTTRIYFYSDPTPAGFTTRQRITVTQSHLGTDDTDLGIYQIMNVSNPNSMNRIWEIDVEKILA
jgi:hypothetical protein